tara:strand:- start:156 stop:497 length:342 start_codon:yes stop_codon:yes gene_type:complete
MSVLDNAQFLNKLEVIKGFKVVNGTTASVYIAYKNAVNNIKPRLLGYLESLPMDITSKDYKRNKFILIPMMEERLDKIKTINKFEELIQKPIDSIVVTLFNVTLVRFMQRKGY